MAVTWKKIAYETSVIVKSLLTEQGDIIYASGVATPAALAHGNAGQVLQSGGHEANPSWVAAGGHDAVTLAVSADVLLGLSTQTLSLDTQSPNLLFAGPVSGAVLAPTFRAMVAADLGTSLSPTFDQGNFTTLHTTTILADHIGEHVGAHTVVFDNTVTLPASTIVPDAGTIGLGSGKGLIQFDDETTDFISFSNCNVGIGTTAPAQKLDVVGSASFSTSIFTPIVYLSSVGDLNHAFKKADDNFNGSTNGQQIRFWEYQNFYSSQSSLSVLHLQCNGNVGIGTTAPVSSLEVKGTGITLGGVTRTTWPEGSGTGFGHDAGTYAYYTGGNVGIGTAAPAAKLDILGAVSATPITNGIVRIVGTGDNPATGSGGGLLFAQQDSGGSYTNYASITGCRVNHDADNYVNWNFNIIPWGGTAVTVMTLTYNGYVGIGSYGLTSSDSGGFSFRANNGAVAASTLWFDTNSAHRMMIDYSGNIGIGMTPTVQFELSGSVGQKASGSTWSNPSDSRLKKDIELADLDRCYEIVKNLPLKRYTLRDDVFSPEQANDRNKLGWVAEDVRPFFAKATPVVPFILPTGEVIKDCLTLDVDQIFAAMYGALQKCMMQIEELQHKNKEGDL